MPAEVKIIDTGIANMGSITRALDELQVPYAICNAFSFSKSPSTHIILPGVGSFSEGISNLKHNDVSNLIDYEVKKGAYVLGICLGMQLMFATSDEDPEKSQGLHIFDDKVIRLPKIKDKYWPHIGWSSVKLTRESLLTRSIDDNEDFYFIHGFAAQISSYTIGQSHFGFEFSAIVEKDNVFGVQFHPEKSQAAGMKLLSNFCRL